jgi:hypothetical protein
MADEMTVLGKDKKPRYEVKSDNRVVDLTIGPHLHEFGDSAEDSAECARCRRTRREVREDPREWEKESKV